MPPIKTRGHAPQARINDKWSYRIKESFLRFFGDLKMFGNQPRLFAAPHLLTTLLFRGTLLYDPRSYRVKGGDMRRAMSDLKPGDILVRGYDNYVDGHFIPGFFSHAGLYLGRVDEPTLRRMWDTILPGCEVKPADYAPLEEMLERAEFGEQMVIHAMKDGIFMEDLLNFCRCDYMVGLRAPESIASSSGAGAPYSDSEAVRRAFTGEEIGIAERLKNGASIPFGEIFPVMFKLALSQLGKAYDFGLDFSSFQKMSCTEFVYYCTKSIDRCSGVHPVTENVMGIRAPGIAPDSFVGPPSLSVAFASQSVQDLGVIDEIRGRYPGPYGKLS